MVLTSDASITEEQKDIIRQRERTIDNLKRLFAMIFSISFGVLAQSVIGKLEPILTGAEPAIPPLRTWILNGEMISVFAITGGVFYHQSTKFLDIRYAKHPLSEAHPLGFAFDYAALAFTVAPFFLMAHFLERAFTHSTGYIWFFLAYILLLTQGLVFLFFHEVRHWPFVMRWLNEEIALPEVVRDSNIRRYWIAMNSLMLFLLIILFWIFFQNDQCPASNNRGSPLWFLYLFGLFALMRDYLDFRFGWPIFFPLASSSITRLNQWPVTRLFERMHSKYWLAFGMAAFFASVFIGWTLRITNLSFWVEACRIG